jgi:hypothetical protein
MGGAVTMAKSNYVKAWKGIQTVRTLDNGSQELIKYDVYVNWSVLGKLAQKAADNKSASSKIGPVLVTIVEAVTDKPKKETTK